MLVYFLITLIITLLTFFEITNTISSQIQIRRHEFAAYHAIGMTGSQIKGMLSYECQLIGYYAILYNFFISSVVSLIFNLVLIYFSGEHFELYYPILPVVLTGVIAIVMMKIVSNKAAKKLDKRAFRLSNEAL
ncbi:MAG: FtsX-like permease family protein [Eubacteriales bacterium]|jgi:ABC-type antimicrobial peptide transport system permease subunit